MSSLMQSLLNELAIKFKETKFLKSISTLCIANFPDENLPSIFVYHNGQLIKQLIGPIVFGTEKITLDGKELYNFKDFLFSIYIPNETEVEWILSRTGAVQTTLEEDPRKIQSRKFFEKYDDSDWVHYLFIN